MTTKQSYLWYIPIVLVMILGYGLGGGLVFGLHFLDWLPSLTDDTARLVLKLFGMGMLGSTMYCTTWWAKDIEEAIAFCGGLFHFKVKGWFESAINKMLKRE